MEEPSLSIIIHRSDKRTNRLLLFGAAIFAAALVLSQGLAPLVSAQSSGYSSALKKIESAFTAVQSAEREGGNVTELVSQLNQALALLSLSSNVSATNPALSEEYIANATAIAEHVLSSAPAIGARGDAGRSERTYLAIGSSAGVVALGSLIYVYGELVYYAIFERLYRGYIVKKHD